MAPSIDAVIAARPRHDHRCGAAPSRARLRGRSHPLDRRRRRGRLRHATAGTLARRSRARRHHHGRRRAGRRHGEQARRDAPGQGVRPRSGGAARPTCTRAASCARGPASRPPSSATSTRFPRCSASRWRSASTGRRGTATTSSSSWPRSSTGRGGSPARLACSTRTSASAARPPLSSPPSSSGASCRPTDFVATHVNYGPETLAAAPDLARLGAWIDVTSVLGPWSAARESIKASAAVRRFLDAGVPLSRISISSDANASVPAGRRDGPAAALLDEGRHAAGRRARPRPGRRPGPGRRAPPGHPAPRPRSRPRGAQGFTGAGQGRGHRGSGRRPQRAGRVRARPPPRRGRPNRS